MEVLNIIFLVFLYILHFGECFASNETGIPFPIRSDYKYDEKVAGWVKWHEMPETWHEARLRCYYEGAVLASPINENLKQAMMAKIVKTMVWSMHTGIHSKFSNRDFTSIEGVPVNLITMEWPKGFEVGDCLFITRDKVLRQNDCSNTHPPSVRPYMCYKRGPKVLQNTICGTDDQEYKYSETTGSCYKFHRNGRTWARAHKTCLAEGGHLAIINSELEAQVLKELFQRNPDKSITATYTHTASIGFQDWGERGSWWTIHGQDLSQAGYDIWDTASLDRTYNQFCGAINRSGKLNDVWCDGEKNTFPAICEINPAHRRFVYEGKTTPDDLGTAEKTDEDM